MARLENLRLGVRVKHDNSSATLAGITGTVAKRTAGHYIDTSVPGMVAVWVKWDNPERKRSLTPQWCGIDYIKVIK